MTKTKDKKTVQLGMNPSTASGKLVKDIIWNFILLTKQHKCYVCGSLMDRDTFSIEHKIPWLDSDDPKQLYFDLNNIGFSHHICNISRKRSGQIKPVCGNVQKYKTGCRCDDCVVAKSADRKLRYNKDNRKAKYKKYKT